MKERDSRKQLLVAESELNRAHLLHELRTMGGQAHALAQQVATAGSMVSAVASLAAALSSFRRKKSASPAEKPSWWQAILKGAGVLRSFWSSFHAPGSGPDDY